MAKTPFKRYNRDYKSLLSGRSLDAGVTGFAETLSKGLMSIYEDKEREDKIIAEPIHDHSNQCF